MAILDSSEETTRNEGEADSPGMSCNVSERQLSTLNVPHSIHISHFPSDSPVNAAVPLSAVSPSSFDQHQQRYLDQQLPSHPPSGPPSTLSSPVTSSADSYWERGSLHPSHAATRPSSHAPSRTGSMSAGVAGKKITPPPSVHIPTWRERRQSEPEAAPTPLTRKPPSLHSDKGNGISRKFSLKDLLSNRPKLNRNGSQRSVSTRKSDSDAGEGKARSTGGDSAVSLTQKYGVCQKVAIGKGATSVVRLAHKWDRTEEKLYAIKVCH